MFKIFLVAKATGKNFSLEAGLADGLKNFDHHKEYSANPAPCRDGRIMPVLGSADIVEITHLDADTYVGLLRFAGRPVPQGVDLDLMERIDLNGSSVVDDRYDDTLLYMVGVGELARELKFPRPTPEGPTDVSDLVKAMMAKTTEEIIRLGEDATDCSEETYEERKVATEGIVGWWSIGAADPLDPSRPYEDGISIVVVHREHYKSVSVYCDPKSEHSLVTLGEVETGEGLPQNYRVTVAGYRLCGHPKAVGTERTAEGWSYDDSRKIFWGIVDRLYEHACPDCGKRVSGHGADRDGRCSNCAYVHGVKLAECGDGANH